MPLVDPVTMSSTTTSSSSKAQQSGASVKAAAAGGLPSSLLIHPHSTAAAQTARHVLPLLLAGLFLAAFSHLVADPVSTMWTSLPAVAVLQALYAALCLPMTGSGSASPRIRKPRPGDKKKATDGLGPNSIITLLLAFLLSVLLTPVLHATMILFGAPLLTHVPQTFLCAAHLSLLTAFPLFYVHGVDPTAWTALAGFKAPVDECYGGLLGGFLGAWLGAVPIPLDWDREWQKWPVTILAGIYAGYLLGRALGGTLLLGKTLSA